MCQHDHLHALKLTTCQGHRSVGWLHFAHLLLFCILIKTAWILPLGQGRRVRCLVGTILFLFFVYTVGVQSIHVDLVIFGIHVKTLMLVCIVGLWKRNRCWCILNMLLKPTTTQALLPISFMCNSLSSSLWQKLPNMVWAMFHAFTSFKELWSTGPKYGRKWFS